MKILAFLEKSNKSSVVCLGRFDGLHIGHKKLIERAATVAKDKRLSLCVFTIRPIEPLNEILSFDEFCKSCENLGVETVVFANASNEFYGTLPIDFLNALSSDQNVQYFVCGEDFTYGKDKAGNARTLKEYCDKNGIGCDVIDIVKIDDKKISSSDIKGLLKKGEVKKAAELIGDNYFVSGVVSIGRKEGRKLGFSTANMDYPSGKAEIKRGVYATKTLVDGIEFDSISNFGSAPTFSSDKVLLETHLIGFSGDLYGKTITVKFVDFIRENKKFDDKNELIEQLRKDLRYYD